MEASCGSVSVMDEYRNGLAPQPLEKNKVKNRKRRQARERAMARKRSEEAMAQAEVNSSVALAQAQAEAKAQAQAAACQSNRERILQRIQQIEHELKVSYHLGNYNSLLINP